MFECKYKSIYRRARLQERVKQMYMHGQKQSKPAQESNVSLSCFFKVGFNIVSDMVFVATEKSKNYRSTYDLCSLIRKSNHNSNMV